MNHIFCQPLPIHALCLGFLAFSLTGPAARAQNSCKGIHGANEAHYQAWMDSLGKESLRPITVTGYSLDGAPRFAAVAIRDASGTAWNARYGLTSRGFQEEFDKWTGKGYRLVCVSGYRQGNATNFAGIWTKDNSGAEWNAYSEKSSQQYQETLDVMQKKGFRPNYLAGYPVGKSYALAAIFVRDGRDWAARHDLTEPQYQKEINTWPAKGYRPVTLTAYSTSDGTRFAIAFIRDKATSWWAKHNLTAADYQKEFNNAMSLGYVPGQVVGYPWQGEIRYAAFFTKPPVVVKGPLPMTGKAVAELSAFDDAMQKFMQDRSITAGTLAVMKNGRLVLSRGYGYHDLDHGKRLGPEAPFRFASIGKPITAAAIMQLIRQGKLAPTTKAFVFLGVKPPRGRTMDKRLHDITVQELLDHKGGWDRDKAGDPMFMSLEIAKALGKPGPASADDVVHYMAGQPLQFTPGSKSVYSNFGYCVLGRVIEKAAGKSYTEFIRQNLLAPIGVKSITLGHTSPARRNPGEPVYVDPGFGQNVLQPKSTIPVPAPDGTFYLEAMDSHGGLIGSAPDLVRFLNAYWMDGSPRKPGQSATYQFFGSLPGTWTFIGQRPDGINLAALFNRRTDPSGRSYDAIAQVLNAAANSIKAWPASK